MPLQTLTSTPPPALPPDLHIALDTNLERVPPACLIEINNRYIWRCDWRRWYAPYRDRFRFVISSDAHQPNWLNQTVARYVAAELGIRETLLFAD